MDSNRYPKRIYRYELDSEQNEAFRFVVPKKFNKHRNNSENQNNSKKRKSNNESLTPGINEAGRSNAVPKQVKTKKTIRKRKRSRATRSKRRMPPSIYRNLNITGNISSEDDFTMTEPNVDDHNNDNDHESNNGELSTKSTINVPAEGNNSEENQSSHQMETENDANVNETNPNEANSSHNSREAPESSANSTIRAGPYFHYI